MVGQLVDLLGMLYGVPGYVLVCLSCIVVGYMFKLYPKFPNDAIPAVCVLWGMILNPLIAVAPQVNTSPRVWLVTHTLVGMIVGGAAWFLHSRVIKKFEHLIPVLGPMVAAASEDTAPKPPSA